MICPICGDDMHHMYSAATPDWWECMTCGNEEPFTEFDEESEDRDIPTNFGMYPLEGGGE